MTFGHLLESAFKPDLSKEETEAVVDGLLEEDFMNQKIM